MNNIEKLREWRAGEILKIFLLKLDVDLIIEEVQSGYYDYLVYVKGKPGTRFGIEVKSKLKFRSKVNKQIRKLVEARDKRITTIPILLVKIDDEVEDGEIDFLVFPSFKEKKLLVRETFKFIPLTNENFIRKVNSVIKWFNDIDIDKEEDFQSEVEQRTITDEWLEEKSTEILKSGFYGTAIIAYIRLVDCNSQDDKHSINSLLPLVKVKSYLKHAISKSKTIKISDYNERIVIEEINYPFAQIETDSFVISKPVSGESHQRDVANALSVIITCMEVMTVALDNGYLIKGGIDIGDTFISKLATDILSLKIGQLKSKNEDSDLSTDIIIADELLAFINERLPHSNTVFRDYLNRFLVKGNEGEVIVNYGVPLANRPDRKDVSIKSINIMISNTTNKQKIAKLYKKIDILNNYSPEIGYDPIFKL
jgi:hypothetical protein